MDMGFHPWRKSFYDVGSPGGKHVPGRGDQAQVYPGVYPVSLLRLVTGLAPASRTHIIAPENAYFPTSLFTGPLPSLVIPKMPDYIAPVSVSHGKVVKDTKPALITYVAAIFA